MKSEVVDFLQQSNYIEAEYDSQSLDDAIEAWKFLIGKEVLTTHHILEAHGILMKTRDMFDFEKGRIRNCNVMVGGRKCPDVSLVSGLFTEWIKRHGRAKTEEAVKKAHVAFERVHPFVDGNGRIGRIIMNWQRVKTGLPILIINEGYEQREYYKWFQE